MSNKMSNEDKLEKLENITLLLKVIVVLICLTLLVLSLYYNKELYDSFNRTFFNIENK
jgi:hypothetical protein